MIRPEFDILTASFTQHFKGRQFLVPPEVSERYNLEVDVYEGMDQIIEFTGEKLGDF